MCTSLVWSLAVAGAPPAYGALPADPALEAELLTRSNEARAEAGLAALEADDTLALAARHHTAEMARLNFFSHTSPTPENASLGHRVARAGGFVRVVGENLAWIGGDRVAQHVARRSVEGWLESPGHRANLLSPEFTHVGFGSAVHADGRVLVAQVFAYQPATLTRASVASVLRDSVRLEVDLELGEPAEVAVFYSDAVSPTETLEPGRHTLSFALGTHTDADATPDSPLHLQLGVRQPGAAGSFIGQDDGWLGADGWRPSEDTPRQGARIVNATRHRGQERVYETRLTFREPLPVPLSGWWGETFVEPSVATATTTDAATDAAAGTVLSASLPVEGDLNGLTLTLGEPQEGERYTLVYGFQLETENGAPQLVPAPPE